MKRFLAVLLTILVFSVGSADEIDDNAAVMNVINAFFAGMTAKDIGGMQAIMTLDGVLYGYRENPDGVSTFSLTHAAYLQNLAARDGVPVERIWEPRINVHDRIAVVWTPYDFYNDGVFSHCGTNTFSLLKDETGWKIAGVVFSIQTEDCAESPLGPYEAAE